MNLNKQIRPTHSCSAGEPVNLHLSLVQVVTLVISVIIGIGLAVADTNVAIAGPAIAVLSLVVGVFIGFEPTSA